MSSNKNQTKVMPSLPPIPPPPPPQTNENVVPAKIRGGSGKTVLVAVIVAILFGGGAFAATYFLMNPKIEEASKETLVLDQRLAVTEAELIMTKAALEEGKVVEDDGKVTPKIGEHLVSVSEGSEDGFKIIKDGVDVGAIDYQVGQGFEAVEVFRVTSNYAYFLQCPDGIGGYIPYEICSFGFYRLDLETDELVRIDLPEEAIFLDLSPGESQILYRPAEEKNIVLRDLISGQETSFPVPDEFSAFGNATFSPDGTRFAYAAAKGDPEDEASAAYIVNVSSQQQEEIKRIEDGFVNVRYWSNNDFVIIQ